MNTIYWHMNATFGVANLHPVVNLLPGANLHPVQIVHMNTALVVFKDEEEAVSLPILVGWSAVMLLHVLRGLHLTPITL